MDTQLPTAGLQNEDNFDAMDARACSCAVQSHIVFLSIFIAALAGPGLLLPRGLGGRGLNKVVGEVVKFHLMGLFQCLSQIALYPFAETLFKTYMF